MRARQVKDAGEGTIPVLGYGNDVSLNIPDALVAETPVIDASNETIVRVLVPFVIRMSVGILNPNVSPAPTIATEMRITANIPEYFKIPANNAIAMITEDGVTFGSANIIIME